MPRSLLGRTVPRGDREAVFFEHLRADWRDTLAGARDWICFLCLAWVAYLMGLVERESLAQLLAAFTVAGPMPPPMARGALA